MPDSTLSGVTEAISTRDAQDRAALIKGPQDAAALLERAEQNGDQVLARAIARHAVEQSRVGLQGEQWGAVLASFVDARPSVSAGSAA